MLTALVFALMFEAPSPAPDRVAPAVVPAAAPAETPRAPADAPRTRLTLPVFAPANETAKELRAVWREHPSIRAGRNLRLDFTFRVQEDLREAGDDPNPVEFPTWELHRLRLGIEGQLFRHIQFQVEREFKYSVSSVTTRTPWRDVFVDVDYLDKAQVRVGRFKLPVGLDQLGGDTALDMIFRSLGGQYLAPGRDQGVMVHGRFFKRGLNYWAGAFLHDGENSKSLKMEGGDETFAARLTGRPFRKLKGPLAEAEVGTSFALTRVSDESVYPNGLRVRTVLSQFTVFDSVFVKGLRRRIGFDIDVSPGPFGVQAEFLEVKDARDAQGLGNENLSDARARSWYLAGSWVVTGEPKAGGVVPRKGLLRGGLGAVEVAARYDQLRFDSKQGIDPPFSNSRAETILPGGDRVWTFGVNWYLNRWSRIQVNAIREHSMDAGRSPTLDGSLFWSKLVRFQLEL